MPAPQLILPRIVVPKVADVEALGTLVEGEVGYDDTENKWKGYDGTVWKEFLHAAAVSVGTAFPTTGLTDGQLQVINADTTNGVKWMFQYRSGSASTYKWEFVGGSPLHVTTAPGTITGAATEQMTSSTYGNLNGAGAAVGPSITPPLAGDYLIEIGATIQSNSNSESALMSYAIGATAASDADAIYFRQSSAGGAQGASSIFGSRVKTALAASTALVAKYKNSSNVNAVWFTSRQMKVIPIRCI